MRPHSDRTESDEHCRLEHFPHSCLWIGFPNAKARGRGRSHAVESRRGVPFGRLRQFDWHAEAVTERRIPSLPSRPTRIVIYVVVLAVALGINYWAAHRVIQE